MTNQLRALRDRYSAAITADLAKLEHQLASVQAHLKTRQESDANLSGLDLGTFGRRLAMGGCRVAASRN
jgi:hypothetical protein